MSLLLIPILFVLISDFPGVIFELLFIKKSKSSISKYLFFNLLYKISLGLNSKIISYPNCLKNFLAF